MFKEAKSGRLSRWRHRKRQEVPGAILFRSANLALFKLSSGLHSSFSPLTHPFDGASLTSGPHPLALSFCVVVMFTGLFRSCAHGDTPSAALQLKQTMEMLEEKENALQKKILIENGRFQEFTKAKNKQAALQSLKRRKFYEERLQKVGSFQSRIHVQEELLLETRLTNSGGTKQIKDKLKDSSGNSMIKSSKSKMLAV